MPFNASGFFQRLFSWKTDRDAGVKILAERMDQETDGIVSGINDMIGGNVNWKGPMTGVFGTEAAPTYSFEDDTDTGLYRNAADSIGLSVGGTKAAELDSTGLKITNDISAANVSVSGTSTLATVNATDLGVSGTSTLATVNASGNINASGAINATGAINSTGGITTDGALSASTLGVFGKSYVTTDGVLNVAGNSALNTVTATSVDVTNGLTLGGDASITKTNPGINFRDTGKRGAVIVTRDNSFYVLRANDTQDGTEQIQSAWPMFLELEGRQDVYFGGHIWARAYGWLHDYFWRRSAPVVQDVRLSAQASTPYLNNFDGPLNWAIQGGAVLTGVNSVHSNGAEDRIFAFYYRHIQKAYNGVWYNIASI